MNSGLKSVESEEMKTILVVDDNEMVCVLLKSILEAKYKIVIRNDGQDALAFLDQGNRPDLILLDMLMPKMNGRTFVRRVIGNPRYGKIPIIFITTVDSPMLINSFKSLVLDYIVKPVDKEVLLQKVEKALNK